MNSLILRFDEKLWQHSLEIKIVENLRKRKYFSNDQPLSKAVCENAPGNSDCCLCSKCSYCAESTASDLSCVSSLDVNLGVEEGLKHLMKIQNFRRLQHSSKLKLKLKAYENIEHLHSESGDVDICSGKYDLLPIAIEYLKLLYSGISTKLALTTVLVTVMEESLSAVNSLVYRDLYHHLYSLLVEKLQKYMRPLLSKYMNHPRNSGVFNAPVDPLSLELPDYFKKIAYNPMDFSSIKNRLSYNQYETLDSFYSDVELVFRNAMLYNKESHAVHLGARFLLADAQLEFLQCSLKYSAEVICLLYSRCLIII